MLRCRQCRGPRNEKSKSGLCLRCYFDVEKQQQGVYLPTPDELDELKATIRREHFAKCGIIRPVVITLE